MTIDERTTQAQALLDAAQDTENVELSMMQTQQAIAAALIAIADHLGAIAEIQQKKLWTLQQHGCA